MTHLRVVEPDPLDTLLNALSGIPGVLVVGQAEPRYCLACGGRRLTLARWLHLRHDNPVHVGCAHCTPSPGRRAIPLVVLPWLDDTPHKKEAA
jgi:hypothetical protein